jgi:hypothetical protein
MATPATTEEDRRDLRDALRELERAKREGVYLFRDLVSEWEGGRPARLRPFPLKIRDRIAAEGAEKQKRV